MVRHIVHLDIPDFYAALEELRCPQWRKLPLVLAESGSRAVIQGMNGIARSEGLQEGMTLSRARRLCRRLQVTPPDLHFYRGRHEQVVRELDRFSPLVEGVHGGRYFIDLTGTHRLWGPPPDGAFRLERHLRTEAKLQPRVGLASNKLISQAASRVIAPGDLGCIFPEGERRFLAALPVTLLPGVGVKTAARLADFNIGRVGELAALEAADIGLVFGRMGLRLLQLARGVDPSPVVPVQKTSRLSLVHRLDRDEIDRDRIETALFRQVEEAGWELRLHNRFPARYGLEIRHADGHIARAGGGLPSMRNVVDRRLFEFLRPVLRKLVQRRVAVRRLVLELFEFVMPFEQLPLFPWEDPELARDLSVQRALDGIRGRFGRDAVWWGGSRPGGLDAAAAADATGAADAASFQA